MKVSFTHSQLATSLPPASHKNGFLHPGFLCSMVRCDFFPDSSPQPSLDYPHPSPVLSSSESWRPLLWRAAANSMAWPWPRPPTSSAQAPLPSSPFSLVTLQRPPRHTTYQAPSHLLTFAQAIAWAWSTLSTSPLTSFITLSGPGQVPPPSRLP